VKLLAVAFKCQGRAMATLTRAAAVPGPGNAQGSGTVQVPLNPDTTAVCYDLNVAHMQEATAAHTHEGQWARSGPSKRHWRRSGQPP
jgi:CHRD domain